ncbi:hypothetical protein GRI38_11445 [Altererythrobacter aurantiacus]|uniref:Uncharacterized protein n=1 Tax=Parapontixanthobacter aurantiacus TaxID=1463599 RepID=A0A844ZLU1_9SPHN|nr:hypothetical protein [Parapontixanthobacter aurantiacus]MXO86639.1 hypothetical protein [Parapontixanthobacter aurantiacus]
MPNIFPKLAAAFAASALAAAPLAAQDYDFDRDDDDGIGAEEVIAGAVILGGLAAILGGGDDDDDYRDDYYYDDRYDGRYYNSEYRGDYTRELIERCVYVAENEARRWGPANVTQIEDVDRDGRYLKVEGDISIAGTYDRRGWNDYDYDEGEEGEFECIIDRRGRVTDIDFDGL